MRLYMEVTSDELQLPIAVATSASELARLSGTTVNNIRSCISHAMKYGYKCRFIIVEIEDDCQLDDREDDHRLTEGTKKEDDICEE